MLDSSLKNIRSTKESKKKDFDLMVNKSEGVKKRLSEINRFRNQPASDEVDILFTILSDPDDEAEIRLTTAEALGWYIYSYRKLHIIDRLNELITKEKDTSVLSEMKKTINRLSAK